MIRKLLTIVLFTITIVIVPLMPVKAKDIQSEYFNLTFNLNLDNSLILDIDFNLLNNSPEIISEYYLDIPFDNAQIKYVKINGEDVGHKFENKKLTMYFKDALRKGGKYSITVQIFNPNFVKETENIREVYFSGIEISHMFDTTSLTVNYPNEYGQINANSEYVKSTSTNENFTKINFVSINAFYFNWIRSLDLKLTYESKFTNNDLLLVNLPYSTTEYPAVYTKLDSAVNGFVDNHLNYYAEVQANNFNYVVNIKNSDHSIFFNSKFDKVDKEILSQFDMYKGKDVNTELLQDIQFKLLSLLNPDNKSSKLSQSDFNYKSDNNLNSLEYSYYLAMILKEKLDLNYRIAYGYMLSSNTLLVNQPVSWVEVKLNDKTIALDTYLSDIYDLNLLYNTSAKDRVVFGYEDSNIADNPVLGLNSDGDLIPPPKISYEEYSPFEYEEIIIESDFPKNVVAGFSYSGDFLITNNTQIIQVINSLSINSQSQTDKLKKGEFTYALLPLRVNLVRVSNLNGVSFIQDSEKFYEVTFMINNSSVNSFYSINFEPHNYLWIFMLIILVLLLLFSALLIFRLKRR